MPHPRRWRTIVLVALALSLAACGGGSGGGNGDGDGDGGTPPPAQSQVTVEATANEPFTLEPGRYRFSWDATGCTNVDFALEGQTTGFRYAKASTLFKFSAIVSDVPPDTFKVSQAEATCTEWVVTLDKIGG